MAAAFACRLCDASSLELYFTLGNDGRFKYYKCGSCGLVNLDLAAGLDQTQCHDKDFDPTDDNAGWDRMIDASFEFLVRQLPDARSLCDIGCGNGRLLYRAQCLDWRVFGLELTAEVAARTSNRLAIEIASGNFLDFVPAPEHFRSYDVVCLRHVLEHLPDSVRAMDIISSLVRPAGHVLLEFPNVESFDKRIKRSLVNMGLHRRRFRQDFMPGHCNEFSYESFQHLIAKTGYRLIRWETYSKKPVANWIYNRFPIGDKARALIQKVD